MLRNDAGDRRRAPGPGRRRRSTHGSMVPTPRSRPSTPSIGPIADGAAGRTLGDAAAIGSAARAAADELDGRHGHRVAAAQHVDLGHGHGGAERQREQHEAVADDARGAAAPAARDDRTTPTRDTASPAQAMRAGHGAGARRRR